MKLVFTTLVLFSLSSFAQDWKWAGFEVIGNHKASRTEILNHIPVRIGDKYKEDPVSWLKWCSDLKSKLKFHFVECSSVRYINFQAYFVVEIIETGYEDRNKFRQGPADDIPIATQEILGLYELLYQRMWEQFNKGIGVIESTDKGYLDYDDKEMHKIVEQLIMLVPQYRKNLLEVLEKDKDINKREKAANLLNWSVNNIADTVVKANRFLDDPNSLVRNNISRFTLHFVDKIESQTDRHGLIERLLLQLDRPTHVDRNKAIYNLLILAQAFPSDRSFIELRGRQLIEYIANTSVLLNVRDPANELLNLFKERVE